MTDTTANLGTAWCPTCRRRRAVIDRHDESAYEGGSAMAWEHHYIVEDLDCGHDLQHDRGTTNTAPGGLGPGLPRSYELGRESWGVDPWDLAGSA